MGNIQTLAPLYYSCNARLIAFYRVRNSSHNWGKTHKNGVRCSTPIPISHPGLLLNTFLKILLPYCVWNQQGYTISLYKIIYLALVRVWLSWNHKLKPPDEVILLLALYPLSLYTSHGIILNTLWIISMYLNFGETQISC